MKINNSTLIKVIFIVLAVFISVVLLLYVKQFSFSFSDKQEDWAGFGSYIGGTLGTFFAFTSFGILFYTFNLQQKQAENNKIQRFENTFNSLVELHNQSLNTLNLTINDNEMFILCNSQMPLREILQIEDEDDIEEDVLKKIARDSILKVQEKRLEEIQDNIKQYVELSQYFRILYQLLKFVAVYNINNIERNFSDEYLNSSENISEEHEKMYASLIRGFVPVQLLPLLALNGIPTENGHHNLEKYKSLLERYEFLEHLRIDTLDNYLAVILILKSYSRALGENKDIKGTVNKMKEEVTNISAIRELHTGYLSELSETN